MNKTTVDLLVNSIIANGFRMTASRRAILTTLADSGGHISADDLAHSVRANHPTVGRMTVYRTLDLLCDLGLIRPIYQGTGAAHYILMDRGSHHHLICNSCGITIEFQECTSAAISRQLSESYNFKIQAHLLEFYGVCEACQHQPA
jgi:Fur family ferric uptake transcriptional regulator